MVIRLLDLCSTPTHWADIGLARPVAARGLRVQPVIHSAIGRWHVTMTDRNEQSVINSLQSAHIADYESVGSEYRSAPEGAQILQFGRLDRVT